MPRYKLQITDHEGNVKETIAIEAKELYRTLSFVYHIDTDQINLAKDVINHGPGNMFELTRFKEYKGELTLAWSARLSLIEGNQK